MEVNFTHEQELQLAQIARQNGKSSPSELLRETGLRLLEEDMRFRAAVREGKESVDRDAFIEEDEMEARLEEMLRS